MGRVSSQGRLEMVASPGCCGFRGVFWVRRNFWCFFVFFFSERTRPAASMRPPCLIYLSTSTWETLRVRTADIYHRYLVHGYTDWRLRRGCFVGRMSSIMMLSTRYLLYTYPWYATWMMYGSLMYYCCTRSILEPGTSTYQYIR